MVWQEVYLEDELWSKRFAKNFDDSSDEEYSREREIQKIEYKVNYFFLNVATNNIYISIFLIIAYTYM